MLRLLIIFNVFGAECRCTLTLAISVVPYIRFLKLTFSFSVAH